MAGLSESAIAAAAFAPYWAGWQTFRGLIDIANLANKSFVGTIQHLIQTVLRLTGAPVGPV